MADPQQVLAVLETLSHAYRERRLEKDTVELYMRLLSDIPIYYLQRAAEEHINTCSFFPRIAELRRLAAKIAGVSEPGNLPEYPIDYLAIEASQLEWDFYHEGILDLETWERLIMRFVRTGRYFRAERTRERLEYIKAMMREEEEEEADQGS